MSELEQEAEVLPPSTEINGPGICKLLGCTARQLHAWQMRRATSGFPEPLYEEPPRANGHNLRSRKVWNRAAVEYWHKNYVPNKGGANYHAARRNNK